MKRHASTTAARPARGFVLMAAMLLLGMISMAVLLSSLSSSDAAVQQSLRTQLALKEAKEAVLGYILLDDPNGGAYKPGSIPCPDRDNDNYAELADYGLAAGKISVCRDEVYVNRFPGRNFHTGELRDSSNEKLWYAISPNFRVGPIGPLNSLTPAVLNIDGQGEYVALILAPGSPLPGQRRADPAVRADFLENRNANGELESAKEGGIATNDRLIGITQKEWEDTLVRRVAADVIEQLRKNSLGSGGSTPATTAEIVKMPWATPLSANSTSPESTPLPGDPPNQWLGVLNTQRGLLPASILWTSSQWPRKNEWYKVIYYVIAPAFAEGGNGNCNDPSQCLTLRNGGIETTGIKALVIFAGRPLNSPERKPEVADYLEGDENIDDDDNVFELPAPGSTSNDRFYVIK